jgi:hypothetical protein
MKAFEIHTNNQRWGFRESLQNAKDAALSLIGEFDVRIEHPCAPAPTAVWRHTSEVSDWVRTD